MSQPWDWPDRASERRRSFERLIENVEYRVVSTTTHRPPTIGFGSCLLIVGVLAIVLLRLMWPAFLMGAVMLGITTPGEMAAVVIGLVILAAVALRDRLAGRRF